MSHEKLETNVGWMGILIAVAISFGGLAELIPLMYNAESVEPLPGMKPYSALEVAGRDIYVREGCYNCHSQMVRTLRFETQRYGHYSLAGESVYDRPFQWGSKRTGPDLARVGGRYSDDWHRTHLNNPRDLVPESNMPNYPWLNANKVDVAQTVANLRGLKTLGHPYTDVEIDAAGTELIDKSEMDALVAYLQSLGRWAPKAIAANTTAAPAPVAETAPAEVTPASDAPADAATPEAAATDAAPADGASTDGAPTDAATGEPAAEPAAEAPNAEAGEQNGGTP
ncbi:cytochrome-c oxidase, cbb3-type subunit II [Ahniella affigens]|uniref:Cytochrome-c oxidase, cbb3-type subunit II n=1 Tax=Ahniella affigens TaxID=2021234 RepID=A0A2P1PUE1_9GAMM|nr:cytochrome-c oxidase, cbb3-type subunit II [Ahniella affigens]